MGGEPGQAVSKIKVNFMTYTVLALRLFEKASSKSNGYRFVDLHDANFGLRACLLYTIDERADVHISGNRRKEIILVVGDDHARFYHLNIV